MLIYELKGKKELWVGQWYRKAQYSGGYIVKKIKDEKEDLHPHLGETLPALPFVPSFLSILIFYHFSFTK